MNTDDHGSRHNQSFSNPDSPTDMFMKYEPRYECGGDGFKVQQCGHFKSRTVGDPHRETYGSYDTSRNNGSDQPLLLSWVEIFQWSQYGFSQSESESQQSNARSDVEEARHQERRYFADHYFD